MWKLPSSARTTLPPQLLVLAPLSTARRPAPRVAGSTASVWQRSPVHAGWHSQSLAAEHSPLWLQERASLHCAGGHSTRPLVAPATCAGAQLASTRTKQLLLTHV